LLTITIRVIFSACEKHGFGLVLWRGFRDARKSFGGAREAAAMFTRRRAIPGHHEGEQPEVTLAPLRSM
jgi:hypothetical protein